MNDSHCSQVSPLAMKCPYCNFPYEDVATTFTVTKASAVYVVRDVPALECPECGHVAYAQDVAKALERFTSGRVIPRLPSQTAWVYSYKDPAVEMRDQPEDRTQNSPVVAPMSSAVLIRLA